MSKKIIIIIIIAFVLVAAAGTGIYFALNAFNEQKEIIADLEDELDTLEWLIAAYGDAVDVYMIREGIEIRHGTEFRLEDIDIMTIPESMFTEQFVTNPLFLLGCIYRVDVSPGTPLVWDLFTFEEIGQTQRYYDIVADVFPIEPAVGQYYDLRIVMPKGQDYVVLSKKRVVNFYNSAIRVKLDQEEIHQYQSALVDTFLNPGTYLYVTTYIEPNMQKSATPYYPVGRYIMQIMEIDPNIVLLAEQDMVLRRRIIFEAGLNERNATPDEIASQIVAGRSEQVNRLTTAAQNVLQQRQQEEAARAAAEDREFNADNPAASNESSNLMSNTYQNPFQNNPMNPGGSSGYSSGSPFIEGGN
jgi:hypothetical protein